ncbi:hypothetical protein GGR54DRAFT_637986 [Hypoxylon sp. NC1633]|nr:hypothetical protein GGR54DRAFT_637986 [Hypoxylon sp. NC1633]
MRRVAELRVRDGVASIGGLNPSGRLYRCLFNDIIITRLGLRIWNAACDKGNTIYDDPEALERYANFLATAIKALYTWAQNIPDALKTKRGNDGVALSILSTPPPTPMAHRQKPTGLDHQQWLLGHAREQDNLDRKDWALPSLGRREDTT